MKTDDVPCPYAMAYITDPAFRATVDAAASNPEYVANWARLRGVTFATDPLGSMIDDATGYTSDAGRLFLADAHNLIWSRLPERQA